MKATVLVDNIGNANLGGEWGLSIYIEFQDKRILLDMGNSSLFSINAQKLGISLKDIDYAVLSHAHYDHANGMAEFFRQNDTAKVYLRESFAENCYGKKWIFSKYIGISKGLLDKYQDRICYVSGDYMLGDGVSLISHKTPGLEKIGKAESMYRKINGRWTPDDFSHEQSLVFETEKGLVIFNSCSHGGADNIIKEVMATYPDKKIYAIVGGFHVFNKSEEYVRNFADRIKKTGITKVYTGHCTGKKAYGILKEELNESVNQLKVGLVMEF